MNPYIGHESQTAYIEEHRLVGGRGDGMRLFEMNNGKGITMTVSADRCCDISRLLFRGVNMSYFSPCGYVAPAYYDREGIGFLKSFTAGFLTTCGLQAVGSPCVDEGEQLPLHGSIANTPAEHVNWTRDENTLHLTADVFDQSLFARKLCLHREITLSLQTNALSVTDTITNLGDTAAPLEILYHMNMGHPLLDEDSVVTIPSAEVTPRNEHAGKDIGNWMHMTKPQAGYEECCYYHRFDKEGVVSVYQPKLKAGLEIHFDTKVLPCFTQWKMMGVRDYVLGLEPGNCYPDGRDVMRRQGRLDILEPSDSRSYTIRVNMLENE